MRTKILLATAAALAAGVFASNAQVYSANVVGYVNVVYPGGQYVMSANPFTTGNDVLTNVIQGATGSSTMAYWTGSGFSTYTYSGPQKKWLNGATDESSQPLSVGTGFFIKAGGNGWTNTYVGSVVANTGGGTATNALAAGYQPVGEKVPYSDVVTNAATVNLQVGGASTMAIWDQGIQAYDPTYTYSGPQHVWKQGATTANPTINPAQGFFVSPSAATNWVQTLQ